ncbi:hypothetical protein [Sorangium sp. So ce854]|uniref:hypothetical protein n=1 Tax=Sorangium sp. So ce854 TaxID=3133322 RepID=UPI003F5F3D79
MRLPAVVVGVGLAAGCGVSASYVPTARSPHAMQPRPAQDVEVFLSRPDRPFQEVGMVEVQQDVANHAGPNALVNELRRVAGQSGCDGLLISGPNDAVFGMGSAHHGGGSFHARTLKGYRGTCLVFTDTTPREPPRGGGGFVFGADAAASEAACVRTSFAWAAGEPGRFTCSGVPADIGLKATSALGFCPDGLCSVELRAEPRGGSAAAWRDELRALRQALEQKYGRPSGQEGEEPPDCASDPERCAESARFARTIRWAWSSGERIDLVLSVAQTREGDIVRRRPEMLLSYRKGAPLPPPAPRVKPEGL